MALEVLVRGILFSLNKSKARMLKKRLLIISTPRLKSLRILHLEPINLVIFQESLPTLRRNETLS